MFRPVICRLAACLAVFPGVASAQSPDTLLLRRVLWAEDRRDSSDHALADGLRNKDAKVALIARRALARIRDPKFADRSAFVALPAPPSYPDPAWRLRYRALVPKSSDCATLRTAMRDDSWNVRLRAADLVTMACAADSALVAILRSWLPTASLRTHAIAGAAWQPAAHALVALAKVAPTDARASLASIATSDSHWLRVYGVRAAAILADTARLRTFARDTNDNVKEAAIDALGTLTGHASDSLYTDALRARGYQAVRAAARALKGAPFTTALRRALLTTATRLRADWSETSRDARLEVMARLAEVADASVATGIAALASDFDCPVATVAAAIATKLGAATAPHCAPFQSTLPGDAVRLALGADVRVRVVMSASSGGGEFVVRLRGDVAPIMAARILQLVRTGYYNGRAWHRVEPDFVIQGPSPGDNEYAGLPLFLRDELGTVPHVRGTVGMSTRGHDTGDAQWFVNLKDNLRLNADYTVFGEIVEGIDVADGMLEGDVIERIEVG